MLAAKNLLSTASRFPTFDTTGTVKASGSSPVDITIGANAKVVLFAISAQAYLGAPSWSNVKLGTVSPGTQAFTKLTGSQVGLDAYYQWGWGLYALLNPGTGAQHIYWGGNGAGVANAWSYNTVASWGTAQQTNGTGTSASHTISAAVGQLIAQAFIGSDGTVAMSNYTVGGSTAPTRYNDASINPIILADTPGAASVVVGCTVPAGSRKWASVAVPLIP